MHTWLSLYHHKYIYPLLIVALLFTAYTAAAQEKKINISGKVTSFEESIPIEGVSVVVKGTDNQTGTQSDGTFTLSVSPSDKILIISLTGYQTQEIKLTGSSEYDIILKAVSNSHSFDFRCCANLPLTAGIFFPAMAE